MKIIPVIDYKNGHVVLAKMGIRSEYLPVKTKLSTSSNIYDVIDSILTLASFKTIYIADLDCIENQQLDTSLWQTLCEHFTHIEFWIDLGSMCDRWPNFMQDKNNARPVVGTESFSSKDSLLKNINNLTAYRPLLSIDYQQDKILGPNKLEISSMYASSLSINDIIILSINHVGSCSGPNLKLIKDNQALITTKNTYYGGGIRDINDILAIEHLGITGVLSASLLHSDVINHHQLQQFTS